VELFINVVDSMGANVVNTVLEFTGPFLKEQILKQGRIGIKILSNLCTERMTSANFSIEIDDLEWKLFPGLEVATKIIEAQ
jgi:hydroxymethylglutaryl-CoA synthase